MFYKQKGNRPVTRPQLLQESLEQCADTVTQKLVSYTTQAERYLADCVNGQSTLCNTQRTHNTTTPTVLMVSPQHVTDLVQLTISCLL